MSTEVTTAQKNSTIAIFDGWKLINGDPNIVCPSCDTGAIPSGWCICDQKTDRYQKDGKMVSVTYFQYHKSWELLMPVVDKISKIPLLNHDNTPCSDPRDVCHPITFAMPTEDGKQLMFRFKGFGLCIADTLIEAVHEGCYEVAKYHNQQKQTNDNDDIKI